MTEITTSGRARRATGATAVARGSLGTGTALDESTQELPIELQPPPPATAAPGGLPPAAAAIAAPVEVGDVPEAAVPPPVRPHAAPGPEALANRADTPFATEAATPVAVAHSRPLAQSATAFPRLSRRSAGLALAGLLLAVGGVAVLAAVSNPDADLAGVPPAGESGTVPSTPTPTKADEDEDDDGEGRGGGKEDKNGNGGGNGRGNGGGNGNGGGDD